VHYKLRSGFQSTYRQYYRYAFNDLALLRKHRTAGARMNPIDFVKELLSAMLSAGAVVLGRSRCEKLGARLGTIVGRVTWIWR
jgi:hypothetical protein